MSRCGKFVLAAGLCMAFCASSYADETCAVKVQNNDTYRRAIDHLRISPSDKPRADEIVTVNRIVLPGPANVTAIHWNCPSHDRSYTIVGMSPEGSEIVVGEIKPVTTESEVAGQPIAGLATKSQ
jgi:hypothetical protein